MDEKRKHIEELREFYKNKKSGNPLKDNTQNNEEEEVKIKDEKNDLDYDPNYIDFNYIKNKIVNLFFRFKNIYKFLVATILFVISIYFLVILVDSNIVKDLVHNREVVIVPNVIGEKLGEAQIELNNKNLKYEIIKRQFDLKQPKGTVIRQVPNPGREIKENRIIYLTISDGIEEIKTPNLINLSAREARVELVNSGLALGEIKEVNSDKIEPGLVLSQNPPKGTPLNYNDKVNIIVSKGSENQLLLVDFRFKHIDEIKEQLEELGLKIGSIIYIEDETYQNGTVIGQFPQDGEIVLKNSYVDLEVVKN